MQEFPTYNLLLHLNEFRSHEQDLKEKYPFIYNSLPHGLESIVTNALTSFMFSEHDQGVFLEESVNLIDYCIENDETSNSFLEELSHSASAELYTPEFYDLLMSIFNRLDELLKSITLTNNFIVMDQTPIRHGSKIHITIKLNRNNDDSSTTISNYSI